MKIRFSAALSFLARMVAFLACMGVLFDAQSARAFVPDDRWGMTASGTTGQDGDPITLTWGIVRDETPLTGEGPSGLIGSLDTAFNAAPSGSDLKQQPWFEFFEDSFARWTELGGITYVYEPEDDGALQGSFSSRGVLDLRGDIRIGGASIDGPLGTLAFNYLPDNGDMVLDTDDGSFFSNPFSSNLRMRNTLMHEAGHGFGLNHVLSNTSDFLMEPSISTAFDGPQFDDIRGLQWFYGDVLEKSNNGQGNDTVANATSLGLIAPGGTVSIGTDAADTLVGPTDIDFVSIDRNTDIDFFSLTVSGPSTLDVVLTPLGPTYNQGSTEGGGQSSIDTSAISDLALEVFDRDGITRLAFADSTGAGFAETLANISLPAAGDYFVRITGDDAIIQFYQLDVSVDNPPTFLSADFDQSGLVDGDDLADWQAAFGLTLGADTDIDDDSDGLDFLTWQQQFEGGPGGLSPSIAAIPEPSTGLLALFAGIVGFAAAGRSRK